MKIEKISDNQIRCTLNPQDLRERHLKLSEFAYGSGKAKELFSDMMEKASEEFNFEADNSPLMIEAIPTSPESLILIITKVENPEELDARFSTFTPYKKDENEDDEETSDETDIMPTLLDSSMLDMFKKRLEGSTHKDELPSAPLPDIRISELKVFRFRTLDHLIAFAKAVNGFYTGKAALYRNDKEHSYLLCVYLDGNPATDFNRICNIACEYAEMLQKASVPYYKEHYTCLMTSDVIKQLAEF
ncbi:MAG: adaptor protein MecA [Lachnospiraceae bacterium]|nr:adaptor protein MecA [Lachnospiraceae bacterium]